MILNQLQIKATLLFSLNSGAFTLLQQDHSQSLHFERNNLSIHLQFIIFFLFLLNIEN